MSATVRASGAGPRPLEGLPDLEIVDLRAERSARNEQLLRTFYDGIYRAAFPIVSEQENPAIWTPKLWPTGGATDRTGGAADQTATGTVELHCLLAGRLLEGSVGEVHGGVIVEFFPDSLCGLITYLAVDPAYRGRGLGRCLVREAIATLRDKDPRTARRAAERVREVGDAALAAHGRVLLARHGLESARARLAQLPPSARPDERARLEADLARLESDLAELEDDRAWLQTERSRLEWLGEQRGLVAVFAEMNDPRRIGQDSMDAWSRMAIFERLGGRILGRRAEPSSPRLLPLQYTQPELEAGQGRNRDLVLLALPLDGYADESLSRQAVEWFLTVFYRSLADKDRSIVPRNLSRDPDFLLMLSQLREPRVPVLTLRPERPSLRVSRFSLALHLVHPDGATGGGAIHALPVPRSHSSPGFASFERDILSYAYRDERQPLWSRSDPSGPAGGYPVTVHFPPQTSFMSEGQSTLLWCADQDAVASAAAWPADADPPPGGRSLELRLLVSRTTFRSGIDVFHLVLVGDAAEPPRRAGSPPPERPPGFHEYDLIKLIKLCEGGEYSDIGAALRFEVRVRSEQHHGCAQAGRDACAVLAADEPGPEASWGQLSFAELVHAALQRAFPRAFTPLGAEPSRPYQARAATVEIQTGRPGPAGWHDVYGCLARLAARETALEELHELLGDDGAAGHPTLGRQVRAIGGIVQGLLDFERIDAWELSDVLEPLDAAGAYALYLQKGVLLNLVDYDRAAEVATCRARIGINPYLMLAHSVLLHNEQVLTFAATALQQPKATEPPESRPRSGLAARLRQLRGLLASRPGHTHGAPDADEQRRRLATRWLKVELLGNIFHYPTERMIFDRGHAELGLAERALDLGRSLDQLAGRLASHTQARVAVLQAYLAVLFGLVSLLSVRDLVATVVDQILGPRPPGPLVLGWYILVNALAYVVFLGILYVAARLMWSFFLRSTPSVKSDSPAGEPDPIDPE